MKRYTQLMAVAAVLTTSLLAIAAARNSAPPQPFLIVGHRYKCVVHGDDFEVTVREVIDHQWIRGEIDGMTMHLAEGERPFSVLVNLSRVNLIMPTDVEEARAGLNTSAGGHPPISY